MNEVGRTIILIILIHLSTSIGQNNKAERYRHSLRASSVFGHKDVGDMKVTFSLVTNNSNLVITKDNPNSDDNISVTCATGQLIPLFLNLRKRSLVFKVPFNISCEMLEPPRIIYNLTVQLNNSHIHVTWDLIDKESLKYSIFYMDNESSLHVIITTTHHSYSFVNATFKNWFEICIATINDQWRTSKYVCLQNPTSPTPVINLRAYSTSKAIFISWDISGQEGDKDDGYIIGITYLNGRCSCVIVYTRNYYANFKELCRYGRIMWLPSLELIKIDNLTPNTTYNISVSSIKENRLSSKRFLGISTKIEGTVSNIRATWHGSYMTIQFNKPHNQDSAMSKYRLKVTLNKINMCTYKYRIIFDDIINTTLKSINVNYWTGCCDYRIEVTPLQGDIQPSAGAMASIIYKPKTKYETIFLIGLNVNLLSSKLMKLSWSNALVEDECNNFGFMVESINDDNGNDCKTWIIVRRTCIQLIDKLYGMSSCKNEEYLRIENGVILTSLLLQGQFMVETKYRIRMWAITDDVKLIGKRIIKYDYEPECFIDCYNLTYNGLRSGSYDGRLCLQWKDFSNTTNKGNYRSNICYSSNKLGHVPKCITNNIGDQSECAVPLCTNDTNVIKCVPSIDVFISRETVTLMWPSVLTTESNIHGYIALLHNSDHDCEKFHIQACTGCIEFLKMNIQIQSFYQSCRFGGIVNELKYETTFEGLQPNKEYFVYIIPLINITSVGEIRRITIGTRVADIINPIYIKITNKTATSLQFQWDDNISSVNNYKATLLHSQTKIEMTIKSPFEMVVFLNLDFCTEYCLYLYVDTQFGQLEFIDTICANTLAPGPRILTLNDIESGPSLVRIISWTYFECSVKYSVEYSNKYRNTTFNRVTDHNQIILDNLERNLIYSVMVKAQINSNGINNAGYSESKEFFTGIVSPSISVTIMHFGITKENVKISWMINDASVGSMFEFIIKLKSKETNCLESINFICQMCPDPFKKKYLSRRFLNEWNTLLYCVNFKTKTFSIGAVEFSTPIDVKLGSLKNNVLIIYGLNLLGWHKLYETNL